MPYIGKEPARVPVTAADIPDDSITAAKIVDGVITAADIASGAVDTAELAADAVTGAKIADNAIDSEHYVDGSIDAEHLASNAVTTAKINADAITGAKIADDAIGEEHLEAGAVVTAAINDDAVTQAKMADDAIGEAQLAASAVVTAAINDDAVTNAKMADDAIDSAQIADGAVDLVHMSSESVDEDNLKISNAGSNGQFLSKQSGNTGGLTWATAAGTLDGLTDCTVSASTPTVTSNPSAVGHLWIEKDTGDVYVCTNATTNANVWINTGGRSGDIPGQTISTFDIFNDSSCKALWHLDGNKTDAGGNYNLTSFGTEVWSTGKFSTAWDGSADNGLYYASSNIVGTSAHSASFWYKSTASQNNVRVFTVNGGTGGQCAGFSNYSNSLGFYTGSGVNVGGSIPSVNRRVEIPDADVNDNAWHHLAWTITSGGTWVLYLDGSEWTGTANTNDSRSFNDQSYVAMTSYQTFDSAHDCDCLIDQVRLFNRVLTATEVTTLYDLG